MHGSEDGELQQGGGEAVSEGEDEGCLLSEQLLHGVLQPQVQSPVTLHKVWQTAARLQKLLHLRGKRSRLRFTKIIRIHPLKTRNI